MTTPVGHPLAPTTGRIPSGRLRRVLRKLSATSDELQADELQEESAEQGCRTIGGLGDRELVTIFGHVNDVTLAPRAGTPTLEATLYDGSGVVTLVWLGRRKIAGIKPGATLVASGRVSCRDDVRTIYNPRYDLQA